MKTKNMSCALSRVASSVFILFSLRALQSLVYPDYSRATMKRYGEEEEYGQLMEEEA